MKTLPELLCPAGSPEALEAAIEGGADAVYLGTNAFNARMNAHNFGGDALRSAVLCAHRHGVKVYVTLNTLVTDRELPAFVETAASVLRAGADALIVADVGGAAAIHRTIPSAELHASTQLSGHCADAGREMLKIGFSRMVMARETRADDLARAVAQSPIEIEMFIHGALCVSHSGQCLFSSLVGGRSGNRGECAQPCRLPYSCAGCARKKEAYPLSLKDLSLAGHVPEIVSSGVASLKIEGRMKSPEYVRDTARVWRKLLDERRAATPAEMKLLGRIFSRGGFTDAYYTGASLGHAMLGVRSEEDKDLSRAREPFRGLTKKIPLCLSASIRRGSPMTLSLTDGTRSVTVCGDLPMEAVNAPLTRETVGRNLTKLGATPYSAERLDLVLDDGLMLPISSLNALRRSAVEAWEAGTPVAKAPEIFPYVPQKSDRPREKEQVRTARFYRKEQITPDARAFFDRIYLPLTGDFSGADGVVLPPVIFDRERDEIRSLLKKAQSAGIREVLVGNLGHLGLVREAGMTPVGDYRLNICNGESVREAERLGIDRVIVSPELTLPQIRDLAGDVAVIVYGRIPLMTLEKCVIRELADCNACAAGKVRMTDRRGTEFPVLREWDHRNVVYNSQPTCLSDRGDDLSRAKITSAHFLFSTESPKEVDRVVRAFREGTPLGVPVRRLG